MDEQQIMTTPRPQKSTVVNIVEKLWQRETTSRPNRAFSLINSSDRFRNISLKKEFDTYEPDVHALARLPHQRVRSRVVSIVVCRDIICALTESGVCAAFSTETNKRICFLNQAPYQEISMMFYNKFDDSLITYAASIDENDCDPHGYLCKTTSIRDIRSNCPHNGFPIFQNAGLRFSDQLVFDSVNGKLLVLFPNGSIKLCDLSNYTILGAIERYDEIEQVKISLEAQLLILCQRQGKCISVEIASLEDFRTIVPWKKFLLPKEQDLEYIQLFNDKLLLKQEDENLQILDVRNSEVRELSKMQFMTPCADAVLHKSQLLLTFREGTMAVWNSHIEPAASLEDHSLCHPDRHKANSYITSDEKFIISKCKSTSFESPAHVGSINISNITTGKCLRKIQPSTTKRPEHMTANQSTVEQALQSITVLHYDEDTNTIYTGNAEGLVHTLVPPSSAPHWN